MKSEKPKREIEGRIKICPNCKINPIVKPFDHCKLCQMIGSYYQYEVWNPVEKWDFDNWKKKLTLKDIENLRVNYWQK